MEYVCLALEGTKGKNEGGGKSAFVLLALSFSDDLAPEEEACQHKMVPAAMTIE